MKSKRGVIAVEGLEIEPAPPPETVLETQPDMDEAAAEVVERLDAIDETHAVAETVGTIADNMEASVERGEGLDTEAAQITNAVLEHFYDRLDYKSVVNRASIAIEGMGEPSIRLGNTRVALEDLQKFRSRLHDSLAVATENLAEKMGEYFDQAEAQANAADELLSTASSNYDRGTPVTEPIASGRWSSALGGFPSDLVKGQDVVRRVKDIEALVRSGGPVALVQELNSMAHTVLSALEETKSNPAADTTQLDRRVKAFRDAARELIGISQAAPRAGHGTWQFAPLDKGEKNQLLSAAKGVATHMRGFSKAWDDLEATLKKVQEASKKQQTLHPNHVSKGYAGRAVGGLAGALALPLGPVAAVVGYLLGYAADSVSYKLRRDAADVKTKQNKATEYTRTELSDIYRDLVNFETKIVKVAYSSAEYIQRSAS